MSEDTLIMSEKEQEVLNGKIKTRIAPINIPGGNNNAGNSMM